MALKTGGTSNSIFKHILPIRMLLGKSLTLKTASDCCEGGSFQRKQIWQMFRKNSCSNISIFSIVSIVNRWDIVARMKLPSSVVLYKKSPPWGEDKINIKVAFQ